MLGLHRGLSFSLVVESGGYSSAAVSGLLIMLAPLVGEHGLQAWGHQPLQPVGPRAQAQHLWCMGFLARWHVGASQIRIQTCASCISTRILYH